jgi:Uma2 family endonuclease
MNWAEVCEHPSLKNLPFKIELNEYGNIVMSPVKFDHSVYQGEIIYLLRVFLKHGRALAECAVATPKGTKVADVAWVSPERFEQNKHKSECIIAPEICIEIISPGNSDIEIQEKSELYFEQGAQEVWICEESGNMTFYDASGQLDHSQLVPDFPQHVEM